MRERVIDAYRRYPWMTGIHVHVGSQGIPLEMMVEGIREVTLLADEINERIGARRIGTIDIGGGLPVDFLSDDSGVGFQEYADALRAGAPRLFSGDYRIVTEFGRSVLAKAGFIAAYVEYTKTSGGRRIAVTHAGAQIATRTVFMPDSWPLRVLAFAADGRQKVGADVVQDVAGPCCFAGDLIARGRSLPELEPGDIVVMPDTGAYYASTPFSYNSILTPGIYAAGPEEDTGAGEKPHGFVRVRAPQTMESLLSAMGGELLV
jgi:diaminopimelate decarboxylase